MSDKRPFLLAILLALFHPLAGYAAPPLNPGRWEVTIKTEAPVAMPATTAEVCITKEKAERPEPPKGKPADDCQTSAVSMNGNVLTYATRCNGRQISSNAKFTYAGDTYEGVVTIKVGKREVRQIYKAKRIGDCSDASQ